MAVKKEEPTFNVTVLYRREVSVFPKLDQEVKQIKVTYVAANLPPAVVVIDKDKYTIETEKRLIKEDIQQRLKVKPQTYAV